MQRMVFLGWLIISLFALVETPIAAADEPRPDGPAATGGSAALIPQTAVLYEEPLDGPGAAAGARVIKGAVTWRFMESGVNGPEIEATLQVPERGMKVKFTIRKNSDTTLPASHVVEVVVETPGDFPGKGIESVPRIVMKATEDARGQPLVGAAAKITDGVFWIALSASEADVSANLALLRERNWFDLPFTYKTGERAILTFEKGSQGEATFAKALGAWSNVADAGVAPSAVVAAAAPRLAPRLAAEETQKGTATCPEIYSIPVPVLRVDIDGFSMIPPKSAGWCGALGLFHSTLLLMRASDIMSATATPSKEPAQSIEVIARRVAVADSTRRDTVTSPRQIAELLDFAERWLASGAASVDLMARESRLTIGEPLKRAPSVAAAVDTSIGLECVRYHLVADTERKDGLLCLDPGTDQDLIQLGMSEKNAAGIEEGPSLTDALKTDVDSFIRSIWLWQPETETALAGFREAAERGLAQAQFSLGLEREIKKDYAEALRWYRLAADQGHVGACHNVGVYYEKGWGVSRNDAEAAKWYQLAADGGAAPSQYLLGMMYAEGRGVPADIDKAVALFRSAADQGLAMAMVNMGVSYKVGNSVPKDPVRAFIWFKVAETHTNQGQAHHRAADALQELAKTMTPDQIAEAEGRVREWKPGAE